MPISIYSYVLNISLKTFFYTLRHQAQVIYPASNVKTLCNRRVLTQKEAFCGKFLNDGRIFLLFYRRLLKAILEIGKTYIRPPARSRIGCTPREYAAEPRIFF